MSGDSSPLLTLLGQAASVYQRCRVAYSSRVLNEAVRYALIWRKQQTYVWLSWAIVPFSVLDISLTNAFRGTWVSSAGSFLFLAVIVIQTRLHSVTRALLCPRCGSTFSIKNGEKRPRFSWTGIPKCCANCHLPRGARPAAEPEESRS